MLVFNGVNLFKILLVDIFIFFIIFIKFDEVNEWFIFIKNLIFFFIGIKIFVLFICREDWKVVLLGLSDILLNVRILDFFFFE